jgi:hypothetical protein
MALGRLRWKSHPRMSVFSDSESVSSMHPSICFGRSIAALR